MLSALSDGGIVSIIRPTGLADLTELLADDPMFTWPLTDLDGWLDNVASSVTIADVTDIERDGLRVFDVQVADGLCPGSTACVPFLTTRGTYQVSVGSSEQTRVWWFTMEPFAPMVVVATGPASTLQQRRHSGAVYGFRVCCRSPSGAARDLGGRVRCRPSGRPYHSFSTGWAGVRPSDPSRHATV